MKTLGLNAALFCLLATSSAWAQFGDPKAQVPTDSNATDLIELNVLNPQLSAEIKLRVGDLVLITAVEPAQGLGGLGLGTYGRPDLDLNGEAIVELTSLYRAELYPGVPTPHARSAVAQPLLKASKPGQSIVHVTVVHGPNWQETRNLAFTVTAERQQPGHNPKPDEPAAEQAAGQPAP